MVMKRCLYGVDLNPLAVELSKLSLWLHAFTAGAPLSFLDHHVKCGNSLIGSKLEDLRREARKAGGLWSLPLGPLERAVQHMLTVAELSDASFEDVERSREEYWAADARVEGYRAMLDSLTAVHFGLREAVNVIEFGHDIDLERYQESLAEMDADWREILEKARRIACDRRFFHWEVEFPEVFFERRGQSVQESPDAGFDAVVGNPPYDVLADKETSQDLSLLRAYIRQHDLLNVAAIGKLNLYELFFTRGLNLCSRQGWMSFILPMALLADSYASKLRGFWLGRYFFSHIDAFPQKDDPHRRVFFEAKLPTAVVGVNAGGSTSGRVRTHPGRSIQDDSPSYVTTYENVKRIDPSTLSIPLASSHDWSLAVELTDGAVYSPFGVIAQVNQGEINETSMAELLSEEPHGDPVVRGGNIQPYHFIAEPKQGTAKYLSAEAYLRKLSGESRKLHHQAARLGFQRNAALDNYKRLIACIVPEGRFCFDSVNYIVGSDYGLYAVLAFFNSRLWEWRFRLTSTNNHVNAYEIHALPVRRILFVTPKRARQAKRHELVAAYQSAQCSFAEILRNLAGLLPRNEDGEFVAFPASITMGEALEKGYIEDIPDYLGEDAPSGYDADGNPLEHSDVVHDFLAYLAEQMMEMHEERQALWDRIRSAFVNKGVDPEKLSSLRITKGIRDQVARARDGRRPTAKQRRLLTYAEQAERAFGCSLGELYESEKNKHSLEDLPRLGFERFKWLAALRGADPALLDQAWEAIKDDVAALRDVLERIGSGDWYPRRAPETGEYDLDEIRSIDWLIDQVVYRLYGLSEDEIRVVEGVAPDEAGG